MSEKGEDHTPYYVWLAALLVAAYFVLQEKNQNIERCIDKGIQEKVCKNYYSP